VKIAAGKPESTSRCVIPEAAGSEAKVAIRNPERRRSRLVRQAVFQVGVAGEEKALGICTSVGELTLWIPARGRSAPLAGMTAGLRLDALASLVAFPEDRPPTTSDRRPTHT
jgi:hypothetical protein